MADSRIGRHGQNGDDMRRRDDDEIRRSRSRNRGIGSGSRDSSASSTASTETGYETEGTDYNDPDFHDTRGPRRRAVEEVEGIEVYDTDKKKLKKSYDERLEPENIRHLKESELQGILDELQKKQHSVNKRQMWTDLAVIEMSQGNANLQAWGNKFQAGIEQLLHMQAGGDNGGAQQQPGYGTQLLIDNYCRDKLSEIDNDRRKVENELTKRWDLAKRVNDEPLNDYARGAVNRIHEERDRRLRQNGFVHSRH